MNANCCQASGSSVAGVWVDTSDDDAADEGRDRGVQHRDQPAADEQGDGEPPLLADEMPVEAQQPGA